MINKCFGNLTKNEPVVSDDTDRQSGQNILEPGLPSGNTIKFIDSTNIPGIEEIADELGIDFQEPQEQLQIFGFNEKSPTTDRESNFVQKIGLKTKIDKNYADF